MAVLHHFTYVSSATDLFSVDELAALLESCRVANECDAITGMLLYKGGNFMQTIEGPEVAVAGLRERLRTDPRHHGILFLLNGTREERLFDAWSMGFRDLSDPDVVALPGYSEFLDSPLSAE